MRPLQKFVAVLVFTPFVAGCDQVPSPTAPTPVPVVGRSLTSSAGGGIVAELSTSASTAVITVPGSIVADDPLLLGLIEACAGESLTFVGADRVLVHQTILADGSRLLVFHVNPLGTVAVGTVSGQRYRLAASDTLAQLIAPSGTFVATSTANLWIIGATGHPRFGGPILLHVTLTPTGDITADIELLNKGFQCLS